MGEPKVEIATEEPNIDLIGGRHILERDAAAGAGPSVAMLGHQGLDEGLSHGRPVKTTRHHEEDVLDHVELGLRRINPAGRQPVLFRKRDQARLNLVELFGVAFDEFHCAPPAADELAEIFPVYQVKLCFRGDPHFALQGRNGCSSWRIERYRLVRHLTLPGRTGYRNRPVRFPVRRRRSAA